MVVVGGGGGGVAGALRGGQRIGLESNRRTSNVGERAMLGLYTALCYIFIIS